MAALKGNKTVPQLCQEFAVVHVRFTIGRPSGQFAFKQEMESSVSVFQKLLSIQKQRLTGKGLLICGFFACHHF